MDIADAERLVEIAFGLRQCLERYSQRSSDSIFQSFPKGCSGPAAELLARYLVESGFFPVSYVAAQRDGVTHSWIVVDGFDVDITADQFGEASVIVSLFNDWHTTWKRADPNSRSPIVASTQWPASPEEAWQYILTQMPINISAKPKEAMS